MLKKKHSIVKASIFGIKSDQNFIGISNTKILGIISLKKSKEHGHDLSKTIIFFPVLMFSML